MASIEEKKLARNARRTIFAIVLVLLLVLIMGAAALLSSYYEYKYFANQQKVQQQQTQKAQADQQRQTANVQKQINEKLCSTLRTLSSLKAPTGSVAGNPSRAYEQKLQKTLAGLSSDVRC